MPRVNGRLRRRDGGTNLGVNLASAARCINTTTALGIGLNAGTDRRNRRDATWPSLMIMTHRPSPGTLKLCFEFTESLAATIGSANT